MTKTTKKYYNLLKIIRDWVQSGKAINYKLLEKKGGTKYELRYILEVINKDRKYLEFEGKQLCDVLEGE